MSNPYSEYPFDSEDEMEDYFPFNERNVSFKLVNDFISENWFSQQNMIFSCIGNEQVRDDNSNGRTTTRMPKFEVINTKKLLGRKSSNNDNDNINNYINNGKAPHTKYREDNIMRKIKARLFEELIEKLNESLIIKKVVFCYLNKQLSEYLKRDYNVELMQRTIADIVSNTPLNNKYKKKNKIDSNKILVKRILEENKETKTINILNSKFIDFINDIRYNNDNLENILEKIKNKEENMKQNKKYMNINKYITKLKEILIKYDVWFLEKTGKNKQKRIKN